MTNPEIGMRVRLKQESNHTNNGTGTIPEGSLGTLTSGRIYASNAIYVHMDEESYNGNWDPTRGYHYPISWLQFKREQ